jgi:putative nucleotidyltransferase with HDIG domain
VVKPAELIEEARSLETSGSLPEAITRYGAAIVAAEVSKDSPALADALRRLSIMHHRRGSVSEARALCERSLKIATAAGLRLLAAESLNTLGAQHLLVGEPTEATRQFEQALEVGAESAELRARVEQNLGILANIRGDLTAALEHYGRSLEAYRLVGNAHGCALSAHNLGAVSADRGDLGEAERHFADSLRIATEINEQSLIALCLVSRSELDVARQRYEDARQQAETAMAIFDHIGVLRGKADAYRVIGMVYRETGRAALAESRLTSAVDLAVVADATLIEAESCRELAVLYRMIGRNQDALRFLNRAHRLFRRLEARRDVVNVGGRLAELQGTYLSVVREWGQSIESTDSHTFGHCERVARRAVDVSRALGLDENTETTILLGAYLHDVGMLKVPHEILTKASALTTEETTILQMHPAWGIELLTSVDFPWDIKPIVRSHHERRDGTGFPDRLRGDEIPITAQVVGILDAYDDLITGRFGAPPVEPHEAVWRIVERRAGWSARVVDAFVKTIT